MSPGVAFWRNDATLRAVEKGSEHGKQRRCLLLSLPLGTSAKAGENELSVQCQRAINSLVAWTVLLARAMPTDAQTSCWQLAELQSHLDDIIPQSKVRLALLPPPPLPIWQSCQHCRPFSGEHSCSLLAFLGSGQYVPFLLHYRGPKKQLGRRGRGG